MLKVKLKCLVIERENDASEVVVIGVRDRVLDIFWSSYICFPCMHFCACGFYRVFILKSPFFSWHSGYFILNVCEVHTWKRKLLCSNECVLSNIVRLDMCFALHFGFD